MQPVTDDRRLTLVDVERTVAGLFMPTTPTSIGVEIELLTYPTGDRRARPDLADIARATSAALPGGSAVSIEPGGQIELSTPPCPDAETLRTVVDRDVDAVEGMLTAAGIGTQWAALDRLRTPTRLRSDPRYRLMEAHFDRLGPAGRWMMNNTASVQLSIGLSRRPAAAWRILNDLGPVLTAAFAQSGGRCSSREHWMSLRQACWLNIDPSRTSSPSRGADPVSEYAAFVLDAELLLVGNGDAVHRAPPGITFGRWLHDGIDGTFPSQRDLDYHLTTLFPPVRPRGWFELRMVDAVPRHALTAVIAVGTALLDESVIDEIADRRLGTAGQEHDAARYGLRAPSLSRAATVVFDIAKTALREHDATGHDALANYQERYLSRPGAIELADEPDGWHTPSFRTTRTRAWAKQTPTTPRTAGASCAATPAIALAPTP